MYVCIGMLAQGYVLWVSVRNIYSMQNIYTATSTLPNGTTSSAGPGSHRIRPGRRLSISYAAMPGTYSSWSQCKSAVYLDNNTLFVFSCRKTMKEYSIHVHGLPVIFPLTDCKFIPIWQISKILLCFLYGIYTYLAQFMYEVSQALKFNMNVGHRVAPAGKYIQVL